MTELSELKREVSKFEELERELHLKQLQINSLLSITQAINNNISAQGLFDMYRNVMKLELNVKKMALYIIQEEQWSCATHLGVPEIDLVAGVQDFIKNHARPTNIAEENHPLIRHFDVIIPVLHKDTPIAYTFVGGFDNKDDRYNKIQFITAITNVISVAIENKRLFKQQIEQARFKHEIKLAKEMQLQLVPEDVPKNKHYELSSIYEPHFSVGGDYYDYIVFDDRMLFCVADIAGKGLAAALLMANIQASLRSIIRKRTDPVEFIQTFNRAIYRITKGDKYVTFFIAEYTPETRKLRYINCGHARPILIQSNGEVNLLDKGCLFLGLFEELPCEIEIGEIDVMPNSLIISYTDGITDTKNASDEFWGDDALVSFCLDNADISAKEFTKRISKHLQDFKGEEDYTDDVTLVAFKTK